MLGYPRAGGTDRTILSSSCPGPGSGSVC